MMMMIKIFHQSVPSVAYQWHVKLAQVYSIEASSITNITIDCSSVACLDVGFTLQVFVSYSIGTGSLNKLCMVQPPRKSVAAIPVQAATPT